MGLERRQVTIPLFLKLEKGILSQARAITTAYGARFDRPLIITDRRNEPECAALLHAWPNASCRVITENSFAECQAIAARADFSDFDSVLGFGGGRALDVGKFVASQASRRYVSIPALPSHDGLASPVAVLTDSAGQSHSVGVQMPLGVLVDLDLVRKAPRSSILAGTGDMISNLSALDDWRLAAKDVGELIDDYALLLSSQGAQMVMRYLEKSSDIHSESYLEVLAEGLILSGIAMNIAGSSRPASGAEHEFSHAIDALYPERGGYHGFQVAFGTLAAMKLRGQPVGEMKEVFARIGLPVHFQELGLTLDEAVAALLHAPNTRPERYSILKKRNLTAPECEEILLSI